MCEWIEGSSKCKCSRREAEECYKRVAPGYFSGEAITQEGRDRLERCRARLCFLGAQEKDLTMLIVEAYKDSRAAGRLARC